MITTIKSLLIAGFLFFTVNTIYASSLVKLSKHKTWLGLLNYDKSLFSGSGYKSKVDDSTFFIDQAHGRKNPELELKANIEKLQNYDVSKITDSNYICRFPARSKWLSQQFQIHIEKKHFEFCSQYVKWKKNGNIKSISLIFASGYFGNPASFFGHPLIKFNSEKKESDLLNSAVNFGAITPDKENPVVYVVKGLFGGYDGSFTHKNFYHNSHNYTEVELRDLWEYVLDLEIETTNFIVDHFWEVIGKKGAYLFFTENCASKIDEKLKFILNKEVMSSPFPQEIPNVLFKNIDEVRVKNKKIYKSINFIPSLRSSLILKYNSLNKAEKNIVKKIIKDDNYKLGSYIDLDEERKMQVNATLLDYYDLQRKNNEAKKSYVKSYNKVIVETLKQDSVYKKTKAPVNLEAAPHKIHGPNLVRLKGGYSREFKDLYKLNIRFALYDDLTTSKSFQNNSDLKILDTHAKFSDDEFQFEEFNLFSVTSMQPPAIDLPGEFKFSWKISIGLENQTDTCKDCLAARADISYGAAFNMAENLMIYGLLSGKVQEDKIRLGHYELKPNVGLFFTAAEWIKLHINYSYSFYLDKTKFEKEKYFAEIRLGSSLNYDFRMSFEKYLDEQTMLGFSYYW